MKIQVILYIALIFALCFTGACTNTDQEPAEIQDNSFPNDTDRKIYSADLTGYRIDLNEALMQFWLSTDTESEKIEELTDYIDTGNITPTVHQIIGAGVDREGKADAWIFGIRYGDNESLVYPKITGWQKNVWPGPLSEEAIITEKIITPPLLFSDNPDETDSLFERSETDKILVILTDGIYYISPESFDGQYEIKFDALTGEVIP